MAIEIFNKIKAGLGLDVKKPEISEEERQYRLGQAFDGYFGALQNRDIWAALIGAVSLDKPKSEGFLRESERTRIIDTYKTIHQVGDNSVSKLVIESGVSNLRGDGFLERVSFNYDFEVGGEERWGVAMEELRAGRRKDGVSLNDEEHFTLERWVERDFRNDIFSLFAKGRVFPEGEEGEEAFQLTGAYRDGSPRPPSFFEYHTLTILPEDCGWAWGAELREVYSERFLPLLKPGELIKAVASHRWSYDKPTITTGVNL